MNNEYIYIVIPTFNRIKYCLECIKSIKQQTCKKFQIVVVDDGSTDNTSAILKSEFPEILVLAGTGDLWWTGATNMGCAFALNKGAQLILTLNDDLILDKYYLEQLLQSHRQQPNSLIGSLSISLEPVPKLLYAGEISCNYWTAKTKKRGKLLSPYQFNLKGLQETIVLPGRGTLIPRIVFDKIGLFDNKNFPQYAADNDFSLRAKDQGYKLFINTEAIIFSRYECTGAGNFGLKEDLLTFIKSFFTFNSPNFLPVSIKYEYRHHPFKLYFPVYFAIDTMRKIGSFLKYRYNWG